VGSNVPRITRTGRAGLATSGADVNAHRPILAERLKDVPDVIHKAIIVELLGAHHDDRISREHELNGLEWILVYLKQTQNLGHILLYVNPVRVKLKLDVRLRIHILDVVSTILILIRTDNDLIVILRVSIARQHNRESGDRGGHSGFT
jgi:hypothetical protein